MKGLSTVKLLKVNSVQLEMSRVCLNKSTYVNLQVTVVGAILGQEQCDVPCPCGTVNSS